VSGLVVCAVAVVVALGLLILVGLARAAGKPRPRPPIDPDLQWLTGLVDEHRADRDRREVEEERGGAA
jgi:hypothetical protein